VTRLGTIVRIGSDSVQLGPVPDRAVPDIQPGAAPSSRSVRGRRASFTPARYVLGAWATSRAA
jgi:hypothetical protein